jgi:hypothetical protein
MHRALHLLVAIVVGGVVGAVSHTVGASRPLVTASVVVSYALLTALALQHPDVVYEAGTPAWTVGRWSGLSAGFVLLVAFFGVGTTLPLGDDLRLSLQILVLGAGWAMWTLGVAYARAKASA